MNCFIPTEFCIWFSESSVSFLLGVDFLVISLADVVAIDLLICLLGLDFIAFD